MQASFINNNNNKNISFEKIYKIKIKHGVLCESEKTPDVIVAFTKDLDSSLNCMKDIFEQSIAPLSKKAKKGLVYEFKKSFTLVPSFEKPKYKTFKILQEKSGNATWWLARHLKMDELKPASDKYHTFYLYTDNDGIIANKALNKFVVGIMRIRSWLLVNSKSVNGNYSKEQKHCFEQLLIAEEKEKILNVITKNKEIQKEKINDKNDWEKFLDKLFSFNIKFVNE